MIDSWAAVNVTCCGCLRCSWFCLDRIYWQIHGPPSRATAMWGKRHRATWRAPARVSRSNLLKILRTRVAMLSLLPPLLYPTSLSSSRLDLQPQAFVSGMVLSSSRRRSASRSSSSSLIPCSDEKLCALCIWPCGMSWAEMRARNKQAMATQMAGQCFLKK